MGSSVSVDDKRNDDVTADPVNVQNAGFVFPNCRVGVPPAMMA
jgi:hypothetical protein